eukprot:Gb_02343 [translate_table: standard]
MEEGNGDSKRPLVSSRKDYSRLKSHPKDELQQFRTSLLWLGLDQSSTGNVIFSWVVFILLAIGVPLLASLAVSCDTCDSNHQRPYNKVVQISESVVATISFMSLSRFVRKYGLRRFLFLDQLCDESNRVSHGYTTELNSAFRLLAWFVLPCFVVEVSDKIWWYTYATANVPFIRQRLMCYLQFLRFEDFFKVFQDSSREVVSILKEHLRIKHQLRVISHRFRVFIVASLVSITFSQFVTLFITTEPRAKITLFKAGDLALIVLSSCEGGTNPGSKMDSLQTFLCSVMLLTGVVIFLHSAARITHKAQSISGIASRWHALATCNSYDSSSDYDSSNTAKEISTSAQYNENEIPSFPFFYTNSESDPESPETDDSSTIIPYHFQTASFHKRQALVKYFEHNHAGITVFGFVLDRTSLHMIFGIEFSLFWNAERMQISLPTIIWDESIANLSVWNAQRMQVSLPTIIYPFRTCSISRCHRQCGVAIHLNNATSSRVTRVFNEATIRQRYGFETSHSL